MSKRGSCVLCGVNSVLGHEVLEEIAYKIDEISTYNIVHHDSFWSMNILKKTWRHYFLSAITSGKLTGSYYNNGL